MSHSNQVQVCFAQLAQQTRKKEKSMSRALTRSELYDQSKKVPSVPAPVPVPRPSEVEADPCAASASRRITGAISSAKSVSYEADESDGKPATAQDIINHITDRLGQLDEAVSRLYSCASPFMKDSVITGYRLQYLESDENASSLEALLTSIANRVSCAHNDITNVCERITFVTGK